jgi:biotin carboxyl carrier protein
MYDAKVTVFPVAAPHVNVSTQLNVLSLTDRTCHMVQIDHDEVKVRDDMSVLPLIVKHTGVEGGVYSVKINSTLFTSTEKEITLEPGQEKAIHLTPKVNLSQQERGRYIVQPQLTLEDPALGIPYNEHVGVSLVGKGFIERFGEWFAGLPWGKLGFCGWVIIMLCILLALLVLLLVLIYAGKIEIPSMTRKSLFVLKTILLVMIIVLLLVLFFLRLPGKDAMYGRAANNTNVEVIEWYQNEQHVLDMSQYFEDPDHDILRYSVTQPKDIKVNLDNNMLTLTPDHNFAGENTMIITASDEKGGVADSPVFKLHVIAKKDMGFFDWMHAWCHYIVAILAILIVLVAFMIILTVKEDRQDLKRGNVIVVVPKNKAATSRRGKSSAKTARSSARTAKRATVRASAKATAKATAKKSRANAKPVAKPVTGTIVREFKAGGKTVNVSVKQQPQQAPTIITVPGAREVIYVGAKNGNTVHTPYCMNARRIPKNKRVAYSTKKEAVKAGLIPCRMCRPFEGGM